MTHWVACGGVCNQSQGCRCHKTFDSVSSIACGDMCHTRGDRDTAPYSPWCSPSPAEAGWRHPIVRTASTVCYFSRPCPFPLAHSSCILLVLFRGGKVAEAAVNVNRVPESWVTAEGALRCRLVRELFGYWGEWDQWDKKGTSLKGWAWS